MAKKGFKNRVSSLSPKMRNTNDLAMDSLADRINASANGVVTMSGRGHGRKTPHGRGPKRNGPRAMKRDMLYFVRDTVRTWRSMNHVFNGPIFPSDGYGSLQTSFEWANALVNDVQFFDCSEIHAYVEDNIMEMYHDNDVPPHPDAILPAPAVGLYLSNYCPPISDNPPKTEALILCVPMVGSEETRDEYTVYTVLRGEDGDIMRGPLGFGNIRIQRGTFELNRFANNSANPTEAELKAANSSLRFVCGLLQTINQPRFVIQAKRDVSLVKRQSFKKAAGKFTPDSWNMVTWNVDKPVKAKACDEGTGGRQALHFRRGHWRKAEKGWERSRWSETRNRWEQYIHGYEAGHPAFGVKKSYHLPRKE